MEIGSLGNTSFDNIFRAFEQAFADYEVQNNKEQLRSMLTRRGFDPDLSFAAFENDEIAAFTLNGVGDYNGMPTAYDTGTGTLKQYRGQGLATKIFEHSIPYLRRHGIKQYLLEVLQHNSNAVSVYRKLGFETTREFNYFIQDNSQIHNEIEVADIQYSIRHISIPEMNSVSEFWDFYPSWQNSFEAIRRAATDFICLGAFMDNDLRGYCVFEPVSGDITQIAVHEQYRRKGIASLLLKEMTGLNKYNTLKVLNTDVSCDSITAFLEAKNIQARGKQFEMIKNI